MIKYWVVQIWHGAKYAPPVLYELICLGIHKYKVNCINCCEVMAC